MAFFPWAEYKLNPQLNVLKIIQNFLIYIRVYTVELYRYHFLSIIPIRRLFKQPILIMWLII